MNKKNIILILIIIVFGLLVWSLVNYQNQRSVVNLNNKIKVVATLFPVYDMAKSIGGNKVEVFQLLPPGVEAHSFELKPSDMIEINEADIFAYTGKYMETWVEDIISGITNKDIKIVDSSRGIKLTKNNNEGEHEHEDDHGHDDGEENEGHNHGGVDPHIWLDFDNAQIMADNIVKALVEKDPNNSEFYKNNANDYKNKLVTLDNNYRNTLSNCDSRVIVYDGHYAFGYLANRYNLQYLAAQGFSPDAEPTANDLVSLVEQIKKNDIKSIFYEELTSPKVATTIAQETKVKMLLLNAAHNLTKDQFDFGVSFFDILNYDLNNLKIGLNCK